MEPGRDAAEAMAAEGKITPPPLKWKPSGLFMVPEKKCDIVVLETGMGSAGCHGM